MRQRRTDRPTPEEHEIDATIEASTGMTHEDQRGVQIFIVFLDKVAVILVGDMLELIVELIAGGFWCFREVLRE